MQLFERNDVLLYGLSLWSAVGSSAPHHICRLLLASHTNVSVKELCICGNKQDEGASWIADLLRNKRDFTLIGFADCCFPFTQTLSFLRGQADLKVLYFSQCRINRDLLLFNDTDFTQLFINNILLSPFTNVETLVLDGCDESLSEEYNHSPTRDG
jgi:hypothetical protein